MRLQPVSPSLDPPNRLSVEQYHHLIVAGELDADDPVELLEGELVRKMPENPRHSAATRWIRKCLEKLIPPGWQIESQEPITLRESEPEPDVMVVKAGDYADRHPGPEDLALVVEVSDTTIHRDRTDKKRIYASEGIPIYWIANLDANRLEVFSRPDGETYLERTILEIDDEATLVIAGQVIATIPVRELIPVV